jgi:integrase/recombinase XerD
VEAWGKFIVNEVSRKTLIRYLSSLAVLQPQLDGLYLDEVDKKLVGGIVEERQSKASIPKGKKRPIIVKLATIKRDLTALSSVLDFAVGEDWIEQNAVTAWLKPGGRRKSRLKERRDPIVLPEAAHIEMVVARAPGLFANMISAAAMTGARLDELAKSVRNQFDAERRQLTLIGKGNKLRTIDLVHDGEDFGFRLFTALPANLETRAVFWHRPPKGKQVEGEPKARPYSQVSTNFRRIVAAVAKQAHKKAQDFRPFTFHHLRHFHAVQWLKSGRSIYALQQRLGHTSVKTTEMYLAYLTAEEAQRVMYGRVAAEGTKAGTEAAVKTG